MPFQCVGSLVWAGQKISRYGVITLDFEFLVHRAEIKVRTIAVQSYLRRCIHGYRIGCNPPLVESMHPRRDEIQKSRYDCEPPFRNPATNLVRNTKYIPKIYVSILCLSCCRNCFAGGEARRGEQWAGEEVRRGEQAGGEEESRHLRPSRSESR